MMMHNNSKKETKTERWQPLTFDQFTKVAFACLNFYFFLDSCMAANDGTTSFQHYIAVTTIITCLMTFILDILTFGRYLHIYNAKRMSDWDFDSLLFRNNLIKIAFNAAVIVMCGANMRWVEYFSLNQSCTLHTYSSGTTSCILSASTCTNAVAFEKDNSPFLLQNIVLHTVFSVVAAFEVHDLILKRKDVEETFPKVLPVSFLWYCMFYAVSILFYLIMLFSTNDVLYDDTQPCIGGFSVYRMLVFTVLFNVVAVAVMLLNFVGLLLCGACCSRNDNNKTFTLYRAYFLAVCCIPSMILLALSFGVYAAADSLSYFYGHEAYRTVVPLMTFVTEAVVTSMIVTVFMTKDEECLKRESMASRASTASAIDTETANPLAVQEPL